MIASFVAARSIVSTGASTTLTAVFSGGTGSIDNGLGIVAANVPVTTPALATTTTFTLTVTAEDGRKTTQLLTVTVVPLPTIMTFGAAKSLLSAGKSATLSAVFANGTGAVSPNVGAVTSAIEHQTPNLSASTTFTLTVTNPAGDSVTATTTVIIVDPPSIASFVPAISKVSRYTSTTLTAVFTGVGNIDQGIGAVSSGVPKATRQLHAKTTYTLTVTNAAGDSITSTTDVDVKRELFVAHGDGVLVFDDDVDGNVAPKRGISGSASYVIGPTWAVFVAGEELFVADSVGHIVVFDVQAGANAVPKRRVSGGQKTITHPSGLFVTGGGEVFLSNFHADARVSVFDAAADGDLAPKRSLFGDDTRLFTPVGVAVDSGEVFTANNSGSRITVHAASADGNTAPLREYGIAEPSGVAINGNELVVARRFAVTTMNKNTFTPIREIVGPSTGLANPRTCFVVDAELACADPLDYPGRIAFWPLSANGDIAPTRILAGDATKMVSPAGLFIR